MSEWWRESFGPAYLRMDIHNSSEEEVETILSLLELEPGARILDLCCGYGRHSIPLAERGFSVVGLDASPVMLEKAAQNARSKGVEVDWVLGDMRSIPFDSEFDAVINLFTSFGYFDFETDDFAVLEEIEKVLKPEGRFLIDIVNRDSLLAGFAPRRWEKRGNTYVLEENSFNLLTSRVETRAILLTDAREEELFWSVRLYTAAELFFFMRGAGLEVIDVVGDWDESEYTRESTRLIAVAEKAE